MSDLHPAKRPPSESLAVNHAIARQAFKDLREFSGAQFVPALVMSIGAFIVALITGQVTSVGSAFVFVVLSVIVGLILYGLIAVIRAPFIVIGQHHRQLVHVSHRVSELEYATPPHLATPPLPLSEPEPTPVPQLEPNIVLEQPEVLDVCIDERNGVIVEGTPRGREHEAMLAHLATYRNLVREFKPVGVAKNTTGRAIYRQYESVAPISKERIAWLSQDHPRVFFEQNDIRKLVLALQDSKDRVFIVQRELSGRGSETRYTPLDDGLYSVWVSVIDEANGHVYDKREFILDVAREGRLRVMLEEASLWKAHRLKDFHEKLSLLKDSYTANLTAPDADAAENAATLARVFDRDMLKSKEFVARHFHPNKAKLLGLSLSEHDAQPGWTKRMSHQPNGIVERMTLFLDRLFDLRVNG